MVLRRVSHANRMTYRLKCFPEGFFPLHLPYTMQAVVAKGDARTLTSITASLRTAASALDKDVRETLRWKSPGEFFLVIGNKAVIYRRMVESMTAVLQEKCNRPLFVCISYNEAWFLENRNRLNDARESTGNRAHVAEFLSVVEGHPWFDLDFDLIVIESDAATEARRKWMSN